MKLAPKVFLVVCQIVLFEERQKLLLKGMVRGSDNRHIGRSQTTGRIKNVEEQSFQAPRYEGTTTGVSPWWSSQQEQKTGLLRAAESRYCGEQLRRDRQQFVAIPTQGPV